MNKRFSGKIGEEYELFKLACPYFDQLEGNIGKAIKDHYINSLQKQIKAIDVGCGSGQTSLIILNSDSRVKVVGVDNEALMIKQAKEILKNYLHQERVELVEKDALEFIQGIPKESFDVIASALTIHNFKRDYRKKFLQDVYRVLKKGGLFVNSDKYGRDNEKEHKAALEWQHRTYREAFSKINKHELIQEWIAHDLEDEKPEFIMREGEAIKQLKEIGFKKVKKIFRKYMHATIQATK